MAFKLVVSDVLNFDVRFSLNDGGKERKFGVSVSAKRAPQDTISQEFKDDISVGSFLAEREMTMTAWAGDSPFVDEATGKAPEPGPDAWEALMNLSGFAGVAYQAYLVANGVQGKRGN